MILGHQLELECRESGCPFCGQMESREWGHRDRYAILECTGCGVLYFPRPELPVSDYQDYYGYTSEWNVEDIHYELELRRSKYRKQLDELGAVAPGKTLLDIGAGPGYFCRVAGDEGWSASGCEIASRAVDLGREILDVRYVELEEVPEASLDVVTCHHVLEHLPLPDPFLHTVHAKLKTNGILSIQVPHQEPLSFFLRNAWAKRRGKGGDTLCALYVPDHLSGFDPRSLRRVMEDRRFTPLRIQMCAMWSKHYDPFFLRNYLRQRQWLTIAKKCVRQLIENAGVLVGRGDWIVGSFRKAD